LDARKKRSKAARYVLPVFAVTFFAAVSISLFAFISQRKFDNIDKLNAEVKDAVQREYDANARKSGIVVEKVELEPASARDSFDGVIVLRDPKANRRVEHEIQVSLIDGKISYNILRMN